MSGVIAKTVAGGASLTQSLLRVRNVHMLESTAGFKVKSRLKLRCQSCYFIRVDGRMHVECHKHPRHKAREIFNVKTLW